MAIPLVLVGAGQRGRGWLRAVRAQGSFRTVGIVDPADKARRAVADEFPDLKVPAFSSIREAARSVEAKVAIVAAFETLRKEHCLESLSAGWHVLSEKPFCMNLADARTVVEAGERAGLTVSVGQNFRYQPVIAKMQELVAAGDIGTVGTAGFYRARWRDYVGEIQKDRNPIDHAHGYLYRQGVHDLDLIRFTLGLRPLRIAATSYKPPWGGYPGATTVTALLEFERGVSVSYFGAWAAHISDHFYRIDGSTGSLKAHGTNETGAESRFLQRARPGERTWKDVELKADAVLGGDGHLSAPDRTLLGRLEEALRSRSPTSISGRDNLWTMAMLEAVVRSTDQGGELVEVEDVSR